MFADMVFNHGKVITMDSRESIAEALAVKFGKILAVGSNEEIKPLKGAGTSVIDLEGRTVIPGLNDTHCHFSESDGLQKAMGAVDASYESGVKSLAEIFARIKERAKKIPAGSWIDVIKEDDSRLAEKRHPTRAELDKVAPRHPVMLTTVGGHFAVVNSKAFEIAGVTENTPDPLGGRFEKDPATGELNGRIHEEASRRMRPTKYVREPTVEEMTQGLKWLAEKYLASGLTCAYDGLVESPTVLRAYQGLSERGELPLRIRLELYHTSLPHLMAVGIAQGFGSSMLKIGGIKITGDGAISARTAAVADSYLNRPGYFGELAITREELHRIVMEGYPQGYRFSIHANGERAIDMVLDVMEEAQQKYPRRDPRNRIIHCTVVTPEIIARIKKLGILPTIFGPYPYYHGDKILPAFGAERLERMFAARSFLNAGIVVAAHSDYPAALYPPLMGIQAMVTRTSANGQPIGLSQKISVIEALKLYTINAAYHTFEESILGSIEPGKLADLVVLGKDILEVPTSTIKDIPVEITMVGGKIAYRKKD